MINPSIFLDTAYVYALVNPRDQWHSVATNLQHELSQHKNHLVTSEFVLTEIGNGLSAMKFRSDCVRVIANLRSSPDITIVPVTAALFDRAFELYSSRMDKEWGLTDCSSFVVMREGGIETALTSDDHFRQAGFNCLMLT